MSVKQASTGKKKRILLLALGVLFFVFGIAAIAGGVMVLYCNFGTDAEGYAVSPVYEVRSSASAFALWVAPMKRSTFSWLGDDNIAQTKWIVKAVEGGRVFGGWARSSDVASYLPKFSYETADQYWHWRINPYYAEIDVPSTKILNQGAPMRSPTGEGFWIDSVVTTDSATIYWDPSWEESAGMNTIVIMNADGSSGVKADLQLGFRVPILTWLPYLLVPLGILMCIGGYVLFRRGRKA